MPIPFAVYAPTDVFGSVRLFIVFLLLFKKFFFDLSDVLFCGLFSLLVVSSPSLVYPDAGLAIAVFTIELRSGLLFFTNVTPLDRFWFFLLFWFWLGIFRHVDR